MTEPQTVSETDYQAMRQKFAPPPPRPTVGPMPHFGPPPPQTIQPAPNPPGDSPPMWSGPVQPPPQTHPVVPPCPPRNSFVPSPPEYGDPGHVEWYWLAMHWDLAIRRHDEAVMQMIEGAKWKAKFIDIVGRVA